MTSSNSTFPYNASECADFLDLLRRSRDDEPNGYTTCIVGRLWSNVSNYRFINHHGQELTRLSRDQAIFVRSAAESSRIPRFWSKWLFGAPDQYLSRFDTVFVDEFLHAHDWRRFMATAHQDWRISIAFSFLYLL
jgi:NADH:ubiquinone oxidoreductase subunit